MMNPHQRANTIAVLQQAIRIAEQMQTTTECKDCVQFDNGYCKHWQDNVPKEAQKNGCGSFLFNPDSAPF